MHGYLDIVKERLCKKLEVGKTYKLGIVHMGWAFSHYEILTITSVTVHGEFSVTYGCHNPKDNSFGYYWDVPHWSDIRTRVVSAELMET